MQPHDFILVISGTNRPNSKTLGITRRVVRHYQDAGINCEMLDLQDLPAELFSPQAYASKPHGFAAVQQKVLDAAGIHLVVPEYNGSFPGVLKYFIDLLKFPESFDRKPVAFVGLASGNWGGLRAVEQMQMVFGYRNAHTYPERVFISEINKKLQADGTPNDTDLDQRLSRQVRGFAQFCGLFQRSC